MRKPPPAPPYKEFLAFTYILPSIEKDPAYKKWTVYKASDGRRREKVQLLHMWNRLRSWCLSPRRLEKPLDHQTFEVFPSCGSAFRPVLISLDFLSLLHQGKSERKKEEASSLFKFSR